MDPADNIGNLLILFSVNFHASLPRRMY